MTFQSGPAHFRLNFMISRKKWAGPGPAHSKNIWNLKKMKKWKFNQKETRNPNSDQYKFLEMILEHKEAFRIKCMSYSKSWIQVLKNHWAGPRAGPLSAMGRPTAHETAHGREWAGPGPAQWVFENLNSAFGTAHKFDSKRFCVSKYHF